MTLRTAYVVDEDGATWWSFKQHEAEAILVREAWTGGVHLTITKAEVPDGLEGEALTDWIIGNVPPVTCEAQGD